MFKSFRTKQFIDGYIIDHCVGFLEINNLYYIIDKEVNNSDDSDLYITEDEDE
jgi:hypothetical protein